MPIIHSPLLNIYQSIGAAKIPCPSMAKKKGLSCELKDLFKNNREPAGKIQPSNKSKKDLSEHPSRS